MMNTKSLANVEQFQQVFVSRSDEPCVVFDEGVLSFGQLAACAESFCNRLEKDGLKPGQRFAVSMENGPEFVVAYVAALMGGFTIVPINQGLPDGDREYLLDLTRPAIAIEDPVVFDVQEFTEFETCAEVTALKVAAFPTHCPETWTIFFTSGTTTRPKAVCHGPEELLGCADGFNQHVGIDQNVRMMHVMPMGYMAGFLNTMLCPMIAGGTIVVAPRFDVSNAMAFWQPATKHSVNAIWMSPTMCSLLARINRSEQVREWTRDHLKHVLVGTSALSEAVRENFESEFSVTCLESYGMTEVLFVASQASKCELEIAGHNLCHGTVGLPIADVEIDVRTCTSSSELFVRSPFSFQGYLDPQTGILEKRSDPWVATGDQAGMDDDGLLRITGRIKDLIIKGGANISPRAVEDVLLQYPGIVAAAVVGVAHEFWGEDIVAWIETEKGIDVEASDLKAHCSKYLASDAMPGRFEFLDKMPVSSTGKVQKNVLREAA